MKNIKTAFLLIISLSLLTACVQQTNWNQYLGPDRNGTINDATILKSWSENGPAELWSFPLGEGYGGASIYGDEVFILDRIKGESDVLRCVDLESGKEKWNFSYEAKGELPFPGSRAVPTVDKKYIWSVGPHGDLYCINKNTHQAVWNHNLVEDYDVSFSNWGLSQSPLIHDDLVIIAPHGKVAGITAFNKTSGELVWKTRPLKGRTFHVSPTLATYGGTTQVIMISPYDKRDSTKINEVVAFDANTGKELWKYDGLYSFGTITPATIIDDTRLFLTDCSYNDNYDPVSIMLEITKENGEYKVDELFLTEEAGSKMHPPVLFEGHLYLNHTKNPREMKCLSLEGEVLWENKSAPDFELGALILVDGMILNQNGKNGDIHLIEPSPDAYKEVGKASFFTSEKSQAWAPLASSQGKLIIRDLEKMVCIDLQSLAD